jgi:hypothetical protein
MPAAATTVNETYRTNAECKAKAMLMDLGASYRPSTPLTTVSAFQRAWNELLPSVRGVSGVVFPSQNGGQLTVDGLYGAQSASAASNFIDPARARSLPARAADLPTWYAQQSNREAVLEMCPPAPPVVPVPPTPSLPVQPVVPVQTALPSVISAPPAPPPPSPPPAALPTTQVVPTQLPPMNVQPVNLPAISPTAPIVPTSVTTNNPATPAPIVTVRPVNAVTELPPITLTAKPEIGGAVLLAGGIAVVAVAAGLVYLSRGRRRR